jgi:hypothetical protein
MKEIIEAIVGVAQVDNNAGVAAIVALVVMTVLVLGILPVMKKVVPAYLDSIENIESRYKNIRQFLLTLVVSLILLLLLLMVLPVIMERMANKNGKEQTKGEMNPVRKVTPEDKVNLVIDKGSLILTVGNRKLQIRGLDISEDFFSENKKALTDAVVDFKHRQQYITSANSFEKLANSKNIDAPTLNLLIDMKGSSYFGAGQYYKGIINLCGSFKLREHRITHMYDMHMFVRYLAISQGRETARKTVKDIIRKCQNPDLTTLWISIPRGRMWDLQQGNDFFSGRYWHIDLSEEDKLLTQEYLINNPKSPYAVFGHYFLGKFDKILQTYPDHWIARYALLSKLRSLKTVTDKNLKEITYYYERYGVDSKILELLKSMASLYGSKLDIGGFLSFESMFDKDLKSTRATFKTAYIKHIKDYLNGNVHQKYQLILSSIKDYINRIDNKENLVLFTALSKIYGMEGDVQTFDAMKLDKLNDAETYRQAFSESVTFYCDSAQDNGLSVALISRVVSNPKLHHLFSEISWCITIVARSLGKQGAVSQFVDTFNFGSLDYGKTTNILEEAFFVGLADWVAGIGEPAVQLDKRFRQETL